MSPLYEISIRGSISAEALAVLDNAWQVACTEDTVLVTEPLDPDAVLDLVKRLANLGLELEEVRRLACPHLPGGAPGTGRATRGSAA